MIRLAILAALLCGCAQKPTASVDDLRGFSEDIWRRNRLATEACIKADAETIAELHQLRENRQALANFIARQAAIIDKLRRVKHQSPDRLDRLERRVKKLEEQERLRRFGGAVLPSHEMPGKERRQ